MEEIKLFDRLKSLYIEVPLPGLLSHGAICDSIAGMQYLEHLCINYLSDKIKVYQTKLFEDIADFDGASRSLEEHFFENYVDEVKRFKQERT